MNYSGYEGLERRGVMDFEEIMSDKEEDVRI